MTGTLGGLARKDTAEPSSASTKISPVAALSHLCLGMSVPGAASKEGEKGKEVLLMGPPLFQ